MLLKFTKFTGKHLCFVKFLRSLFFTEHLRWLLLIRGQKLGKSRYQTFSVLSNIVWFFYCLHKHFIQDCTRPAKRFHDKILKNDPSVFKLNSFSKFVEKNNENIMKIIFKTSDVIIISDRYIRTKIASSVYQLPGLQMTYDVGKKFIFIFLTRYRNTLRVSGNEKKTNITKYF